MDRVQGKVGRSFLTGRYPGLFLLPGFCLLLAACGTARPAGIDRIDYRTEVSTGSGLQPALVSFRTGTANRFQAMTGEGESDAASSVRRGEPLVAEALSEIVHALRGEEMDRLVEALAEAGFFGLPAEAREPGPEAGRSITVHAGNRILAVRKESLRGGDETDLKVFTQAERILILQTQGGAHLEKDR